MSMHIVVAVSSFTLDDRMSQDKWPQSATAIDVQLFQVLSLSLRGSVLEFLTQRLTRLERCIDR